MFSVFTTFFLLCSLGVVCGITDRAVFSGKTAYDWVISPNASVVDDQYMTTTLNGKTCTAVHVNLAGRHGYRNPGADDMEDYTNFQQKVISKKDPNVFTFIDTWVNRYAPAREDMLVETGRLEWKGIGERLGRRFKALLQNFSNHLDLTSSTRERAIESATQFYAGFTKAVLGSEKYDRSPATNNTLIRMYDDCDRLEYTVDENDDTYIQLDVFQESAAMQNVVNGIASRLGMDASDIEIGDLEMLYELCAFEMAIYHEDDWCSIMTDDERKVLEYQADIENYYEDSYGSAINVQLGCVLVENMFTEMDRVISNIKNGASYKTGSFKFGHDGGMSRLYAALGLDRDNNPLLATNMNQMTNRKFRTSIHYSMANNLVFALYRCSNPGADPDFAITMFRNEEPATIPSCGSSTCSYAEVRQAYADHIDNCNRDQFCEYDDSPSVASYLSGQPHIILLLSTMAFLTTQILWSN